MLPIRMYQVMDTSNQSPSMSLRLSLLSTIHPSFRITLKIALLHPLQLHLVILLPIFSIMKSTNAGLPQLTRLCHPSGLGKSPCEPKLGRKSVFYYSHL